MPEVVPNHLEVALSGTIYVSLLQQSRLQGASAFLRTPQLRAPAELLIHQQVWRRSCSARASSPPTEWFRSNSRSPSLLWRFRRTSRRTPSCRRCSPQRFARLTSSTLPTNSRSITSPHLPNPGFTIPFDFTPPALSLDPTASHLHRPRSPFLRQLDTRAPRSNPHDCRVTPGERRV